MIGRLTANSRHVIARAFSTRPEICQVDNMLQIGTRSIFTPEHDLFRDSARKFFTDRVKPFHDKWEEEGQISRECWLEAGEMGLLGSNAPEKYGGMCAGLGADMLTAAIVWEEQGYSGCSGPGFSLHSDIVIPYILHYGTEEQKMKFVPKLCKGEWVGALGMTEPGAGSDLQGMRTTAEPKGDHYVLNGSKVFITNGAHSDVVVVAAKTDPAKGAKGMSLLLVEQGMEGFKKGRKLKKMGLRAQDTSELFFDNVRVPKGDPSVVAAENLLGEEGKGFIYMMKELPQERLLIADISLASSEAIFETTRSYVKERKAFGKTVNDFQVTKHNLAEMKTEITVARAFTDQCLRLHNEGRLDSAMASMAKYFVSDLRCKIADRCVQLHGGWGYMWEYPVCKEFVDARVQPIYGGTNEIMKELIARSI